MSDSAPGHPGVRHTLQEISMIRKLALVAAVVAATLTTNALSAQTAAPAAKPGPAMHVKLDSSTSAKPSSTHHAAWTQSQIKEAQQGLAKAGLYKGKVSGAMNADTRKALRAYQKQNKLPVTGRLDDTVLARLKSA
jgi:peptidoglycan hydrolase-like protein with peptidoglycan-binding domain